MASNRTQTSTFLEEASLKTIYVALGNSLCPRSTFLTIHLTTEVFTRKNTSSVWAKVNSLYWTEWKLQMIMKGLGLVQLAPCLFFFFFLQELLMAIFRLLPYLIQGYEGKEHRDHLHTGSWSKKYNKPGTWDSHVCKGNYSTEPLVFCPNSSL